MTTEQALIREVEAQLRSLGENRVCIVANYYATTVRVGIEVDPRADASVVTSANRHSPVLVVVERLAAKNAAVVADTVTSTRMTNRRGSEHR